MPSASVRLLIWWLLSVPRPFTVPPAAASSLLRPNSLPTSSSSFFGSPSPYSVKAHELRTCVIPPLLASKTFYNNISKGSGPHGDAQYLIFKYMISTCRSRERQTHACVCMHAEGCAVRRIIDNQTLSFVFGKAMEKVEQRWKILFGKFFGAPLWHGAAGLERFAIAPARPQGCPPFLSMHLVKVPIIYLSLYLLIIYVIVDEICKSRQASPPMKSIYRSNSN